MRNPGTGGDKLPLEELLGSLLLVTVHEETDPIPTEYGDTTAIRADVAVLDGTLRKQRFEDTLIFPRVLKAQLRGAAGEDDNQVLGRLEQGKKKPGKNPPWQLTEPTAADLEVGELYLVYLATLAPVPDYGDPEASF
ncbi:MAG TPA: hypothetical protein VNJ54_11495 [Plantibacter sp.]|uniref:hypothetical protein n=1 Tax=Plantibacter sp. TaxID=1871045 RepID=UPI002BB3D22C|nr:hypothetical protein [Plantibacter sp.]